MLLAALASIAVVVLIARSGGNDEGTSMVRAASADADAPAATGGQPNRAPLPAGGPGNVLLDDDGDVVAQRIANPNGDAPFTVKSTPEQTAAAVAEYRRINQYPPTSQLLDAHHKDLMEPNQRYEQPLPSRHDETIRFLYSGTKNTIVGDEPIETYLQVTRNGQPHPVKVLAAVARVADRDDVKEIPLAYSSRGAAFVNQFSPAAFGVDRVSMVETEIWFEVGPDQEDSRSLRFFYTPQEAVPARFTGAFRDVIENGSLVIYAGVEVEREGHYLIDCNLYGPADEPVMFARHKGPLPAGRTEVRLLFFGKALRDKGVQPPFHIGQLRGGRFVLGQDPDTESMPLEPWSYTTTTRFTLGDLSDEEWDSEHKRHMIELIETYGTKPGADPQ